MFRHAVRMSLALTAGYGIIGKRGIARLLDSVNDFIRLPTQPLPQHVKTESEDHWNKLQVC